ncbi:uncharacterized protein EV420DRAFT_1769256 [Desarmillaria tabescens]|uniref:Uncharacterized protein n=1 Tax=Armillaria tabescens TaxID=1929756 RepID=A0AA39JDJ5_ARMTA|nr:uncharacterized protein EV420DRAFT_1769256 [Desarmillaria tabescens]KAK0440414.1 hypothetical protein EV420DRAFT_1769256 [Desarmillaria tabescens]
MPLSNFLHNCSLAPNVNACMSPLASRTSTPGSLQTTLDLLNRARRSQKGILTTRRFGVQESQYAELPMDITVGSGFNDAIFNVCTRGLTHKFCYWIFQIIGSVLIGLLDRKSISRRICAYTGWTVLFLIVLVVYIWGYFYQGVHARERRTRDRGNGYLRLQIRQSGVVLHLLWDSGRNVADDGVLAYGCDVKRSVKAGILARFYKSIQSAGAAWRADAVKIPYVNMFISESAFLLGGLVFALPMIIIRIKDHTILDDETVTRMDDE